MLEDSITTVLVEDHEITRLGLRKMLEHVPAVLIVGEAGDGKAAVDKVTELRPALVLMDIGLPIMDGIEVTRLIKESLPSKVILITSHENDEDIFAGLSAGADAYCLKGVTCSQLTNAINSVMEGAVWLDPGIAQQVMKAVQRGSQVQRADLPQDNRFRLSERECEILALLVEGMTNNQMAERLFLSAETIKTHMRHIMEKLRVSDRTQAAVKAVQQGLVTGGSTVPVPD